MTSILTGLQRFAASLTQAFALPGSASAEDQLKPPMTTLFAGLNCLVGAPIASQTEAHVGGLGGRPDMAVFVGGLLAGHVELKAPGLGANPARFRDVHSKKQWEKFKALPNLIYTDGAEWALYRLGERAASARAAGDPAADGLAAFTAAEAEPLGRLLQEFLMWQPQVPHDSAGLARYLAPLARLLRDDVEEAAARPESAIATLNQQWRRVLLTNASDNAFADAYAQTVVYSLAGSSGRGGFPAPQPGPVALFLRRFFGRLRQQAPKRRGSVLHARCRRGAPGAAGFGTAGNTVRQAARLRG